MQSRTGSLPMSCCVRSCPPSNVSTASHIVSHTTDRLDGALELDCSADGKEPYTLSRAKAKWDAQAMHACEVHRGTINVSKVSYTRHGCCISTGSLGCTARPSQLGQYGAGVVMYFKNLKTMAWLGLLLSVAALPALVVLSSAAENNAADTGAGANSALGSLADVTLASLGESQSLCASAVDGDMLELSCPGSSVIGALYATYGISSGLCRCPPSAAPARASGQCPGTQQSDGRCFPEGSRCVLEDVREVRGPTGVVFGTRQPCCARTLIDNRGDFSDMDFTELPGCLAAEPVQRVVRGVCMNAQSCKIAVNPLQNVTWTPQEELGTTCKPELMGPRGKCRAALLTGSSINPAKCVWPNATVHVPPVGFSLPTSTPPTSYDAAATGTALFHQALGIPSSNIPVAASYQIAGPTALQPGAGRLSVVALCYDLTVDLSTLSGTLGSTDKSSVVSVLAVSDLAVALAVLLSALVLHRWEKDSTAPGLPDASITAADYTVEVSFLPHLSETELTGKLYNLFRNVARTGHAVNADFMAQLQASLKQKLKRDPSRQEVDAEVSQVVDVQFGGQNTAKLQTRLLRGEQLRKWEKQKGERERLVKYYAAAEPGSKRHTKLGKQIAKLSNSLDKRRQRISRCTEQLLTMERDKTQRADVAYVTFLYPEARDRALNAYPRGPLARCVRPRALRLDGKPLRVTPAAPPSDILWENLSVSRKRRALFILASLVATALVLAVCATVLWVLEDTKRSAQREVVNVDCTNLLGDLGNKTAVVYDEYYQELGLPTGRTGRLECYCRDRWDFWQPTALFQDQFFIPAEAGGPKEEALCASWLSTTVRYNVLLYGSAIFTVCVNLALRIGLRQLSHSERHTSKTAELVSTSMKLFLLSLLNTAALVVLLNLRLDAAWEPLRRGTFRDFSVSWYQQVGVSLTMTLLAALLIPHLTPAGLRVLMSCRRCADRKCTCNPRKTGKFSQLDLTMLYKNPELRLSERYAQLYVVFCTALIFSAGLPLLLPIACVWALVCYWVDKALFIRGWYSRPPMYDATLGMWFTVLLPLILLIKLPVSVWMLSNPTMFPPSNAVSAAAGHTSSGSSSGLDLSSLADPTSIGSSSISSAMDVLGISVQEVQRRMTQPQVIAHIFLWLALVLGFVFSRVVYPHMRRFFRRCLLCRHNEKQVSGSKKNRAATSSVNSYFDVLTVDTLAKLKGLDSQGDGASEARKALDAFRRQRINAADQAKRMIEAHVRAAERQVEAEEARKAEVLLRIDQQSEKQSKERLEQRRRELCELKQRAVDKAKATVVQLEQQRVAETQRQRQVTAGVQDCAREHARYESAALWLAARAVLSSHVAKSAGNTAMLDWGRPMDRPPLDLPEEQAAASLASRGRRAVKPALASSSPASPLNSDNVTASSALGEDCDDVPAAATPGRSEAGVAPPSPLDTQLQSPARPPASPDIYAALSPTQGMTTSALGQRQGSTVSPGNAAWAATTWATPHAMPDQPGQPGHTVTASSSARALARVGSALAASMRHLAAGDSHEDEPAEPQDWAAPSAVAAQPVPEPLPLLEFCTPAISDAVGRLDYVAAFELQTATAACDSNSLANLRMPGCTQNADLSIAFNLLFPNAGAGMLHKVGSTSFHLQFGSPTPSASPGTPFSPSCSTPGAPASSRFRLRAPGKPTVPMLDQAIAKQNREVDELTKQIAHYRSRDWMRLAELNTLRAGAASSESKTEAMQDLEEELQQQSQRLAEARAALAKERHLAHRAGLLQQQSQATINGMWTYDQSFSKEYEGRFGTDVMPVYEEWQRSGEEAVAMPRRAGGAARPGMRLAMSPGMSSRTINRREQQALRHARAQDLLARR